VVILHVLMDNGAYRLYRMTSRLGRNYRQMERLHTLLRKLRETWITDRRHGSGRLKCANTEEIVTAVKELSWHSAKKAGDKPTVKVLKCLRDAVHKSSVKPTAMHSSRQICGRRTAVISFQLTTKYSNESTRKSAGWSDLMQRLIDVWLE